VQIFGEITVSGLQNKRISPALFLRQGNTRERNFGLRVRYSVFVTGFFNGDFIINSNTFSISIIF
jgi:hypothetical protein